MNAEDECIRSVSQELSDHGISGYSVTAVTKGDQVLAQIQTSNGRIAEGTEDLFRHAIARAIQDGKSLEDVFEYMNLFE